MKRIMLFVILVLGSVGMASANVPELFIKTGSTTVIVTGAGSSVAFSSSNFGGWELDVIFGKSNSPGLSPFGIDLTNLSAACVGGGGCSDLHVWLSATDFTQVSTGFTNTFSSTQTGAGASATQIGWVGLGNNYFEGNGSDGPPTVAGGSLIPGITLTGSGGFAQTTSGVSAGPGAYSLTIEDIFKGCTGTSCASYSADGSITAPEPGSLAFLGSLLSLGAAALWRRKSA